MGGNRDLAVGSVLGRYELVLRIAGGGMGEVWAARLKGSRGFQKVVAIKTLVPELSHNPDFERMFLDEATLAARLKHPNVVEVIDLGEDGEVLYQVMEWVEGASLWAVMRAAAKRGQKALPLPVAAGIVSQVCAGLHAAHELREPDGTLIGLVHRDVSPQNVLLTPRGFAKVVDFGVAKFAGRGASATRVGELRGKVPYMAPEHVRGEELDRRADVFALGVLFYQLLSGVHPFLASDDALTLARIVSDAPARPLREVAPAIPEEVCAIVTEAIAKPRETRLANAALLRRRIEGAVPDTAGEGCREAVAAFCHGLGTQHFPARARELRAALSHLDNGSSAESAPVGRESLVNFPLLPPGQIPSTFLSPDVPTDTPPGLASDRVAAPAVPAAGESPSPAAPAARTRLFTWIALSAGAGILAALAVGELRSPAGPAAPAPAAPAVSVAPAPAVSVVPTPTVSTAPEPEPMTSSASPLPTAAPDPVPSASASAASTSVSSTVPPAHPRHGKSKGKGKVGQFTPRGL
jgi:serine/threonine-protein kinase